MLMVNLRRLVLDVMKPYNPTSLDYASALSNLEQVKAVNIALIETDQEVENIKITLVGDDLDYEQIKQTVEDLAGAVHSIDEIAAGDHIIETVQTPQDTYD